MGLDIDRCINSMLHVLDYASSQLHVSEDEALLSDTSKEGWRT